jgi:hypothetical protein
VRAWPQGAATARERQCVDRRAGAGSRAASHTDDPARTLGKMGVNARLLDAFDESPIEVRKFNNAD